MSRSETSNAALEAVWARMVEIAEEGHDLVVLGQAAADDDTARRIASRAADLAALASAAIVLARPGADDGA